MATDPEVSKEGATVPELPLYGATDPEVFLEGATDPEVSLDVSTDPEVSLSGATDPEVPLEGGGVALEGRHETGDGGLHQISRVLRLQSQLQLRHRELRDPGQTAGTVQPERLCTER